MNEALIRRLTQKFGFEFIKLKSQNAGYRSQVNQVQTNEGDINLVVYKNEPHIEERINNINRIGAALSDMKPPVRTPLDNRIMVVETSKTKKYVCVYNWIDGTTIPWEAYTMEHIKNVGLSLAQLHLKLKNVDPTRLEDMQSNWNKLASEMIVYFSNLGVKSAMTQKLKLSVNSSVNLDKPISDLNKQVIHMDYVRGNLLFDDKQVVGILDFEKAVWGSPLYDLARTLAFLLVDCKYKVPSKVWKYFVESGYIKRGLNGVRPAWLNYEAITEAVNMFLFYDFYKFLKHNPYEDLAQNEHFTRTRNYLIKREWLEQLV